LYNQPAKPIETQTPLSVGMLRIGKDGPGYEETQKYIESLAPKDRARAQDIYDENYREAFTVKPGITSQPIIPTVPLAVK